MNIGALNCLRGERAEEKREGKRNQGPPLVQEGGGVSRPGMPSQRDLQLRLISGPCCTEQ
jgi:hypothetical protein